ncbi:MAG: DUF3253 domain-containing protein [Pseudomonadota bacterium]
MRRRPEAASGRAEAQGAPPGREQVETVILALAAARGAEKSFCPSEAARLLSAAHAGAAPWRALTPLVQEAGAALASQGRLSVLQRGAPVDPAAARGPIRYAAPRALGSGEQAS